MASRKRRLIGWGSVVFGLLMALPGQAQRIRSDLRPDWRMGMQVVGYADRLSVQQGETIRFMVSSELPTFRADLVRLIHGDANPLGPGFKEEVIDAPINKEYPGRRQELPRSSYIVVPDNPALRQEDFTLAAWIAPTTPGPSPGSLTAAVRCTPRSKVFKGSLPSGPRRTVWVMACSSTRTEAWRCGWARRTGVSNGSGRACRCEPGFRRLSGPVAIRWSIRPSGILSPRASTPETTR